MAVVRLDEYAGAEPSKATVARIPATPPLATIAAIALLARNLIPAIFIRRLLKRERFVGAFNSRLSEHVLAPFIKLSLKR